MERKRYADTCSESFYGNYLYDQIAPQDHFLRLLNQLLDWNRFKKKLIGFYRGCGGYIRPPFNPVQMALKSRIQFGSIQVIDSVHSIANVNTAKDEKRIDGITGRELLMLTKNDG